MPRVYCDHNFLIIASGESQEYRRKLAECRERGIELVLSTWHWVEMVEDPDEKRGVALAEFADSLNPLWLRERRHLQQNEAAQGLFAEIKCPYRLPEPVARLDEVLSEMTGEEVQRDHCPNSPAFVRYMRTPEGRAPLLDPLQAAIEAQREIRKLYQAGSLTRQIKRQIQRRVAESLLPDRTPQGALISRNAKREFVREFREEEYPSVAVESALSLDALKLNRALTEREFRDRQHAISLPYVDQFVTDDRQLRNIIGRITPGFHFTTAHLLLKTEFDQKYLLKP